MRLFDMHCDTLYECRKRGRALARNDLHIDLTRGRQYQPWGQVFAVWMPDTLRGEAAFVQCAETLHFAKTQEAGGRVRFAETGALQNAFAEGRCGSVLAVEGGSALAGELRHVDDLRALGVRVLTLTWNGSNELGHGCLSGCADGLTPFGRAAVKRMEEVGIVADVSHLNERGFWDAADLSERPFIASHSVSAAVNPHPRNLTDEQFLEIRRRGGVVGLNLCADQLGGQSFEQFERHWVHFLELGGEYTVGLGCDLDGTHLPDEWNGIAVMAALYETLYRKNYEEACLDRLFFSNCYNFFAHL